MIQMVVTAPVAPPDLCPIVPAACLVPDSIDLTNPIGSFFDSWFSMSAEESLQAAMHFVFGTPEPDFSAEWFKALYVDSGIVWLGWSIATLVLVLQFSLMAWRKDHAMLLVLRDYMLNLLTVSVLPLLVGGLQALGYAFTQMFMAMTGSENADDLAAKVPSDYYAVGWMSFMIRALSVWLMLELVFISLAFILTVLAAGMFFSLRVLGAFGDSLQAFILRYILLGVYAKPVMIFVIGFVFTLMPVLRLNPTGSQDFMMFGAAAFAIFASAAAPLGIFKVTKKPLANAAVAVNGKFEPRSSTGSMTSTERLDRFQASSERRIQRRQSRRETLTDIGSTVVGAGAAALTGGATAGLLFAAKQTGGKPRHMKTADGVGEITKLREKRQKRLQAVSASLTTSRGENGHE